MKTSESSEVKTIKDLKSLYRRNWEIVPTDWWWSRHQDDIKPHIRSAGKRHQASLQGFEFPKFTSRWNNFENRYSSDFLFRSLSNTKISQVINIHVIYQSSVLVSLPEVFLGASGESRAPGVRVHDRRHSFKIEQQRFARACRREIEDWLRPAWSARHSSSLGLTEVWERYK